MTEPLTSPVNTVQIGDQIYNLSELTREELQNMKLRLLEMNDSAKAQIAAAKSEAWATGVRSDPDWYSRANYFQHIAGRAIQAVDAELRRRKVVHSRAVEGHFVDVARERMDSKLFGDYMTEANRRAED